MTFLIENLVKKLPGSNFKGLEVKIYLVVFLMGDYFINSKWDLRNE